MLSLVRTPLVRLGNLFPRRAVYAKCEFTALGGSFKIRGAVHLLERLAQTSGPRLLVVPSMGNTALGAATAVRAYGFTMLGVVPQTISRAKDERLQSLGVELLKISGAGSELLRRAAEVAPERGGYLVHPHLDPRWTDGYQAIMEEILTDLPDCRSLIFPVGGGGLLMGLTEHLRQHPAPVRLAGCEAYNYPTYAPFTHARARTIADGLVLEDPHRVVQERIAAAGVAIHLVQEEPIRQALADLYRTQALLVEPSSAVPVAFVQAHSGELEEPIAVVLTGENITREDFFRLIADAVAGTSQARS
jgi:threonine dehydratase